MCYALAMTNTTSSVPTTLLGIVCGRCSHGFGKERVVLRHADVAAVRACFAQPVVPVVEVPAPALPQGFVLATIAEPTVIDNKPKTYGRWFAKCRVQGCKQHKVADAKFKFTCPDHKWVRVWAKQLVGKFSTAAKHKCNDACMFATGPTCTCSCGGVNHGLGFVVSIAH